MEAYRDQYATLFNNGRKVVVLGISVDADTTLASWTQVAKSASCTPHTMPRTNWIIDRYSWWVPMDELHM